MFTFRDDIVINASREAVWRALFEAINYRQWASVFSPGATVQSTWREGGDIIFADSTGTGLAAIIQEYRPNDYLSVRHAGAYGDGRIDTDSEEARKWAGNLETYALSDIDGKVRLDVRSDLPEEYREMMEAAWAAALPKIKHLAEAETASGTH